MSNTRLQVHVVRFFLALTLIIACGLLPVGSASAALLPNAAPVTIDISSLREFLDTLSPDEKDEQLRDWALYGLKSSLALQVGEEMPIRHPALKASGEVSPGRVFAISKTEWGLLAAPELLSQKALLGGLIDRKNATCNALPEKIFLFSYTAAAPLTSLNLASAGVINAKDFFTSEYGYYSAPVANLTDLTAFIGRVDDLVSFSWQSGRLVLGGRKYLHSGHRALTVQDVAALYQAYNPVLGDRSKLEKTAQERYAQLLRSDTHLQKGLKRGTMKKARVLAQLRRQLSPPRTENVGFSLDPQLDYPALAGEIRKMTDPHAASLHSADPSLAVSLSLHRQELNAAVDRLEKRHDLRPLLALRRRYESSPKGADLLLGTSLHFFETEHSYQSARYDGNLQGTGVGMILFYTDLLAKLWALDYQGLAPKGSVKGFRVMQEIPVPKTDWSDFVRLSKTRLWFGLRGEAFDVFGNQMLFQPAVTRVYAASSDPLFPGKETLPNYQSAAFLGWWDNHYDAVAAVELYYHKLDQIQKWGCAFLVLREKRSHQLDFLQNYPVQHDLDFASWSKSNPVLANLSIPFLDAAKLGRHTECLPLLKSRDHLLMGKYFVLSGGVSLASRKDILAKLHKHAAAGAREKFRLPEDHFTAGGAAGKGRAAGSSAAAPGIEPGRPARLDQGRDPKKAVGHFAAGLKAKGETTGAREPAAGKQPVVEARPSAERQAKGSRAQAGRRAPGRELAGRQPAAERPSIGGGQPAAERQPAAKSEPAPGTQPAGRPEEVAVTAGAQQSTGGSYGTFSAERQPGSIKLNWKKSPTIALHDLVAQLAALQQAGNHRLRGEAIFDGISDLQSVVRVQGGSAYLVKTGASGNRWIYLGINPVQSGEYPARAAAAFPEADIFCAKLVSEAGARKLATGKQVLR